jgi:RND family efflux transporter MFP subunit
MNKVLVLPFCLVLFVASCSSKHDHSPSYEVVRDVAVQAATDSRVPDLIVAVGTVRAAETSQIAAQVMGNVTSVNVREGDSVNQGRILATVDPTQAVAGLQRAEAALAATQHELAAAEAEKALTESTLKRFDTLYQRKSVSPQEYDEMKARFQGALARAEAAQAAAYQAKAGVKQAQTDFSYTKLRAPFAGIVTERRVDPGTLATPGMHLLTIEALGHYRLEATIDETDLHFVNVGDSVPVVFDSRPDQPLTGKVTHIVPAADPNTRTFLLKIELPPDPMLRSGLFGRASLSRGERDSLMVPKTAIVDRGALKAVYVVGADQIASLRYVSVGQLLGDHWEVLSGLNANEAIVVAPMDKEIGGKKVEIRQ